MGRVNSLEGLRGAAALVVVFSHCVLSFWPQLFGVEITASTHPWLIAVFNSPATFLYNGAPPVYVFFVLSGYVLSAGYLRGGNIQAIQTLALSRPLRLAIPVTGAALISYFVWSAGWYTASGTELTYWIGKFFPPEAKLSLAGALWEGTAGSLLYGDGRYNFVTWTMQIEFFGSFLVFANCILLRGVALRHVIYLLEALILTAAFGRIGWLYSCFLLGMLIADVRLRPFRPWLSIVLLALALWLFGYRDNSASHALGSTLGFTLGKHFIKPDAVAYMASGGLLVLLAVHSPAVARLLSMRPIAALGSLSFSLYLIHPIVLSSIGIAVFSLVRPAGFGVAALTAFVATVTCSLLLAAAYRPVDRFAIKASKQIAQRMVRRPSTDSAEVGPQAVHTGSPSIAQ